MMRTKRKILIIIDGWGDAYSVLKKTKTPNMDAIAKTGRQTYMYPIRGTAPESGASQFVILGQPLRRYPGRGPVEALGAGIKLQKKQTAIRCNFARLIKGRVTNIRAPIPSKNIIAKLNRIDRRIRVVPTLKYRALMIVSGIKPNRVRNTHPGYVKHRNFSEAGAFHSNFIEKRTGLLLIDNFIAKAERIMKNKTILLRGAGRRARQNKKMKKWLFIGDMPVERGLAKMLGMSVMRRPKTLASEIRQIVKSKKNIYLQIKGPDTAGHEGNCRKKIKAIEKIDRALKPLVHLVEEDKATLCITSDHATPCASRVHTSDAVPFIIAPYRQRLEMRIQGKDVMKIINKN